MRLSHQDQMLRAELAGIARVASPETCSRPEQVSPVLSDDPPVQLTRALIMRTRAVNISAIRLTQSRGAVSRFNAIDRAVRNLPSPRRRE